MTTSEDWLLAHPLFETVERLRSELSSIDEELLTAIEPYGGVELVERAGAVADLAEGLPASVDPRLVPRSSLDSMQGSLEQVVSYVTQLRQNPAVAGNIGGALDAAVQHASQLSLSVGSIAKLTDEIGKKVGRAVSRRAAAVAREVNEIEGRLAELRGEVDAARAQATAEDEQRVAAQQQRLAELTQALDAERQRVDSFVTSAVTENESQEAQRNQRAQESLAEQKAAMDDLRQRADVAAREQLEGHRAALDRAEAEARQRAESLAGQLEADATKIVEHLEQRKQQVDALHEVTVQAGLSGAFAEEAAQQASAADKWRRGTIAAGLVAVLVAVGVALDSPETLTVEALVAKLAVTAGFAALATYCAKQSGQHRERESAAKGLELDLVALAPFLEQLEPDQRTKAIESFVTRWMATRAITGERSLAYGAANAAELFARALPIGNGSSPPAPE